MTRSLSLLFGLTLSAPALADGDPKAVSFEKDVLPVLKAKCFSCHDGRKATNGLRLDIRSKAFKGGESGAAGIVAGKPETSEIYRRVSSADEADRMPPKGEKLTAAEAAALKVWIAAGAAWPDSLANDAAARHWAFVAPKRSDLPVLSTWYSVSGTPIDTFARAKLEKEGLKPSPEADKTTLCRRLYLDLIGLPPSPKEVDEFLADKSPDAYGKLVERLLASPHYGERWGRLWLDAARYADSDGFEKDKPRFVWHYRDWVINAFNKDLPYDRFVIEQIAGDLLPSPTQDQIVATGFLRNSMINEEGGVDPEQFRMEAMFDRMDAVGKGILGLTIQCAQCHSHKFDPLTQLEYYRLFAFLNNADEKNVTVYTPAEQLKRAELFRQMKAIEDDLKHATPVWEKKLAAWEASVPKPTDWVIARPTVEDISTGGERYLPQKDGSFLALGYAPTSHGVKMIWETDLKNISAFRLELMNDPNLPRGGPGRSIEGTGALSEFEVDVAPKGGGKAQKVKFVRATSDAEIAPLPIKSYYHNKGDNSKRLIGPASFAIDGKNDTAWGHDVDPGRRNLPRTAYFFPEKPIAGFEKGTIVTIVLKQNHGGWNSDDNQNCNLGRLRVSVTAAEKPEADAVPTTVRAILNVPAEKRSPAQRDALFSHWRTTVPEWKEASEKIDELWKQHPEGSTQLTLGERADPRSTHLLKRGDFLKPAEEVGGAVPAFLHPMPKDAPPSRLGFARWLVDKNSPTTARAYVNRVWQAYFGAGLVATPEDLGTQSAVPSHPELLDWLAVEFMTDWSVKKLHRLIVSSATYKQASKVTPELLAKDPTNRLLARGPRVRVDAEIVRDVALSASGLLNPAVGGPSVFPPIPNFLMLPPASYGPKVWKEDTGPERFRRSLYVFRFRSVPYPPLAVFDAPTGDFACVARPRSNTPVQSLVTLNEPIFVECAQALGKRVLAEGGSTDAEKVRYAFRLVVARPPTDKEVAILTDVLAKESAREKATPQTAWTAVARVLLNLDETITKE
jgi:hypothetical protein